MRVLRTASCLIGAGVLVLGLVGVASAATQTVEDTAPGGFIQLDQQTITRDLVVTNPGAVTGVTIEVDFGKFGNTLGTPGACLPFASGSFQPYANEIGLRLVSPAGTTVVLVQHTTSTTNVSAPGTFVVGASGSGNRWQILFDDAGPALPNFPVSGTYAPAGSLSVLVGELAAGTWTVEVQDRNTDSGEPTCYYGASLTVETDAPTAVDSSTSTPFGTPVGFTLDASDPDDDPLAFTIDGVTGIGGDVVCDPPGGPSCIYTPPDGEFGDAIVEFTVSDGVLTDTGIVTITVGPNGVPEAVDSAVSTPFETATSFALEASDPDDHPLTYSIDGVSGIGGDVVCDPSNGPDCVYTPPAGVSGDALVAFTASDGWDSDSAVVTITVQPEPPYVAELEIQASATEVDEGGSIAVTVTGTDQYGNDLGDLTDQVTFTSDVETDRVVGNTITFPTASPHTITATHVDGAVASIVIEVIPAAVVDTPVAEGDALPRTGGPDTSWLVLGLALMLSGVALVAYRGRRTFGIGGP